MPDHERTDIHPGAITLAAVGLAIFLATVLGISLLLFRVFGVVDPQARPALSTADPGRRYDGPLLQLQPEQELAALRAANAQSLNQYAWEDRGAGAVRIPIDVAMKLLVARGLPAYPSVTLVEIQQQRANPEPGRQLLPPK